MSSISPGSEIGFDSEDSEIYYIAELETEGIDESRLSISQTLSDNDQADLYADDPLANENGQSNTRRRWMLTKNSNEL